MPPENGVEVEAFSREGALVARQSFSNQQWYDGTNPLIDSNEERERLRIARIEGRQFDYQGRLDMWWTAVYREDGSISELREWRSDGSVKERQYPTRRT
jgi:hypothetical protein